MQSAGPRHPGQFLVLEFFRMADVKPVSPIANPTPIAVPKPARLTPCPTLIGCTTDSGRFLQNPPRIYRRKALRQLDVGRGEFDSSEARRASLFVSIRLAGFRKLSVPGLGGREWPSKRRQRPGAGPEILQVSLPQHRDVVRQVSRDDIGHSPNGKWIVAGDAAPTPSFGWHISE